MTREVIDNFEDHIMSLKTEWHVMKEKWFHGEMMDPVFEGVVRDFCAFDETMHNVHSTVQIFMKGVEQLASGMMVLSDGVANGLSHASDSLISSDSCKLKEATNQIARGDAPHSSVAKLRRDMQFNILNPVQNHITNNKNLKVSLDIRRRRLIELNSAKKHFDDVQKKTMDETDRRYIAAHSTFEAAKSTFNDVDRHVFEWLYILEEYRGDILDSTLQTLKYLEYEFFASSAHAISTSLPSRMEFRPMVEMTPEHLEAQVEMELQKSEDNEACVAGAADTGILDFSARLIDKKVKEEPSGDEGPVLPVDILSLSSLLSQGFEEGPARKALRKHQNNTQAALDWLINGQAEDDEKKKMVSEGVRMPTTVKRVQKLKAMRRSQAEKLKEKEKEKGKDKKEADDAADADDKDDDSDSSKEEAKPSPPQPRFTDMLSGSPSRSPPAPPADLLDSLLDEPSGKPAASSAPDDLLGFEAERPAVPTDFSKPLDVTALPAQLSFDTANCEKQPLSAAVAAGLAQPRAGSGLQGLDFGGPQASAAAAAPAPGVADQFAGLFPAAASASSASAPVAGGYPAAAVAPGSAAPVAAGGAAPANVLAAVQALAAQSGISSEELLRAAQQQLGGTL